MSWQPDMLIGPAQLKALEQQAEQAGLQLIEKAGSAIAAWLQQKKLRPDQSLLIAVGPGNNGADALVAARLLQQGGTKVIVWQPVPASSPACLQAAQAFQQIGGSINHEPVAPEADILLDGLFGAGLHRPLAAPWTSIIQQLNERDWTRIAIDVPSGLNAWTGDCPTQCLRADHTLALLAHKPGLFTADGPDNCGKIHLLDMTCPERFYPEPEGCLITSISPLPPRQRNSHKGSYGTVHIIGGNHGMVGAAMLAARSALHAGAGKVMAHTLDERLIFDPSCPELMISAFTPGDTFDNDVIGIGPGLGCDEHAIGAMYSVMQHQGGLVLDADALNLLAQNPLWQQSLQQRKTAAILTPHPAEAARLLQTDTPTVQRNRIKSARKIAEKYSAIVVLKGAGSIVCAPSGAYAIINAGNAALANAGQGDVLTGLICSLLAQNVDAWAAACHASYLHANSADLYAIENPGLVGMTASITISLIKQQLAQ